MVDRRSFLKVLGAAPLCMLCALPSLKHLFAEGENDVPAFARTCLICGQSFFACPTETFVASATRGIAFNDEQRLDVYEDSCTVCDLPFYADHHHNIQGTHPFKAEIPASPFTESNFLTRGAPLIQQKAFQLEVIRTGLDNRFASLSIVSILLEFRESFGSKTTLEGNLEFFLNQFPSEQGDPLQNMGGTIELTWDFSQTS